MDRNFFLAIALSLLVYMLWWEQFGPRPAEKPPTAIEADAGQAAGTPDTGDPQAPAAPAEAAPAPVPTETTATSPSDEVEAPRPERKVEVATKRFRAELSSRGGTLTRWELVDYQHGTRDSGQPIVLTTGLSSQPGALSTPFSELGLGDLSAADFDLIQPAPNQVSFRYSRGGYRIFKDYRFSDDAYSFELELRVENATEESVSPLFGVTLPASAAEGQDFKEQGLTVLADGSREHALLNAFGKGSWWGGEPEREKKFSAPVDWVAVDTTYFVSAVVPDVPAQAYARMGSVEAGKTAVVQLYFAGTHTPPGRKAERLLRVYMGPKDEAALEAVDETLISAIDLGWQWVAPLTRAFHWLLQALYGFIPNYGLAIIVLTILVRLVTAPLTTKQMRSMEKMRALAPKLQELREKYPDDRQKQSEEQMKLYRLEGVNPLGGCFPMLIQLPVFVGLFYSLRSSIELRQAPFFGWIHDLSAPEVLFVVPGVEWPLRLLPLIMGATMFFQQKLTPMQQMDPMQQRMMTTLMPVMMTFFFYQFPSGLVLYWMVSNVLAIAHQLWVGRGAKA